MLYLCQLDYPDIEYLHNMDAGGPPEGRNSIKTSGCGLCSISMIVDHLTTESLSITDCRELSYQAGANRKIGTSMRILAPVVAEKFDLELTTTNSLEELKAHLASGGEAIAHVAANKEIGYKGLFTRSGHYIVVVSAEGDDFCILDPSYKEGKFDEEDRIGKVNYDNAPFLYCNGKYLLEDTANRDPGFYLFKRKKSKKSKFPVHAHLN
ncbi:MAG: hypothetical protein IKW02_00195 [Clostridia bacterium]|nr:hypothetical protein [Clostridia bacterium]